MKRVIDDKRYDAETAECVHGWTNDCGCRDLGEAAVRDLDLV
jgi:hypothetical protein